MDDPELAAYQAALLELLASGVAPAEMQARLAADPAFAPYREYTATFEPRSLEIASALVRRWAAD